MQSLWKRFMLAALAVAVVAAPGFTRTSHAQAQKPVVVVSISGINPLFSRMDYLMGLTGAPKEQGDFAKQMLGAFTAGIDKTKPWGAVVTTDGEDFVPMGFIPVTNLKVQLDLIKAQIGEPKDAGNGVLELDAGGMPVYVKESGGWAFIGRDAESLGDLPKDPAKLLGGLNTKYELGVRAYVQNIPAAYRAMAVEEMKKGYERSLEASGQDPDDPEVQLQRKLGEQQVNQLASLIEESNEITMGWAIDETAKKTYLDFSITAVQGTDLDKQMALQSGLKSAHSGFMMDDAAVSLTFTGKMAESEIDQAVALLGQVQKEAVKNIEENGDLPSDEARDAAKSVLTGFFDVLMATVKSGELDGGAVVTLAPKSLSFVMGGACADTAKLEATFKEMVKLAENEPDFPGVKMNADKHGDVAFHTMSIPVPDEEDARKVFGDTMEVVVGIGKDSAFMALGTEPQTLLKKVIDKSKAAGGADAQPMILSVAMAPIMDFAASMEEGNPPVQMMADALQAVKGNDHIAIRSTVIPSGQLVRIEVEDGIIAAFGKMATAFGGGGGF